MVVFKDPLFLLQTEFVITFLTSLNPLTVLSVVKILKVQKLASFTKIE
jgi:hypothetical protein